MKRDPAQEAFARIQDLVRHKAYEMTIHARKEAKDDDLHDIDVESAVLTGALLRVEYGDPRGPTFVIVGWATDLVRRVGVVARFDRRTRRVIITVYEIREG